MIRRLLGIPVSPGIVYGPLVRWNAGPIDWMDRPEAHLTDPTANEGLWRQTKDATLLFLKDLQEKTTIMAGAEQGDIFMAHQMILEDPAFDEMVRQHLHQGENLGQAIQNTVATLAASFEGLDNSYMKERAGDIRDIGARLLEQLAGSNRSQELTEPALIAANDLAPSQTAQLDPDLLLGIVLAKGGRTSHTAILARALDIPAVVAVAGLEIDSLNAKKILINGDTGEVILDPTAEELAPYQTALAKRAAALVPSGAAAMETFTSDGHAVHVAANIGSSRDLKQLTKYNVAGVGLCRTEFLFLESDHLPTEAEQIEEYRRIVEAAAPYPVIFRTLDIGGDKELPYLQIAPEANPFLGVRAIRLALSRREMFRTQLRALLRASVYGQMKVMFPMIATIEEFREAMAVAHEVEADLRLEQLPFEPVAWGIMIEVPAAALIADILAAEVDFFSIGTNDLIQYTMAADRLNEQVNYLYQPLHPAILRLLERIISAAHHHGKPVGMCGEMAGTPEAAALLLGLGLDEFSMSPAVAPRLKQIIATLSYLESKKVSKQALTCGTVAEVRELLSKNGLLDS